MSLLIGMSVIGAEAILAQSQQPSRPDYYEMAGPSFQITYEKQLPLGKPWPVDLSNAKIEVDNSLASSWGSYFKDWKPTPEHVRKTLSSYYVISGTDWAHTRSHVAGNDRGGWVTLKDGTKLKWMLRPGGLGLVLYPDGGAVYLDACCPEKKQ